MKRKIELKELVEIRCPIERVSKTDKNLYKCNRICVKVLPGSAGEAKCRSCHINFLFEVDEDSKPATGIRVKKLDGSDGESFL